MIIVMLFLHNICKTNGFGVIYKALIQTSHDSWSLVSRIVTHKYIFKIPDEDYIHVHACVHIFKSTVYTYS